MSNDNRTSKEQLRVAQEGCAVSEDQYISNMLDSLAGWLEGRSETYWAKEYGHDDLMQTYAKFLRRFIAARASVEPAPVQGLLSMSFRADLPQVEFVMRFDTLEHAQAAREVFTRTALAPPPGTLTAETFYAAIDAAKRDATPPIAATIVAGAWLDRAIEALERCYDVTEWPAETGSFQLTVLNELRALRQGPTKNPVRFRRGDCVANGAYKGVVDTTYQDGIVLVRWRSGERSCIAPGLLSRRDCEPGDSAAAGE